ncbi:hypothetical protein [Limosilactobacillus balticus]|uniref:hypothetical protein n=1 Tax=Limosilactobacillus balticus TaxID=2759747 RepID=UPI001E309DF9|nr:hypothetical protein [Limosilactobacillus balticus]MCD7132014.1 hypothetical protein [Limosilactobacillus balticus]
MYNFRRHYINQVDETDCGVAALAIVGGGKINSGFLEAGLVDEISILIGADADRRTGQPSLFDGRPEAVVQSLSN